MQKIWKFVLKDRLVLEDLKKANTWALFGFKSKYVLSIVWTVWSCRFKIIIKKSNLKLKTYNPCRNFCHNEITWTNRRSEHLKSMSISRQKVELQPRKKLYWTPRNIPGVRPDSGTESFYKISLSLFLRISNDLRSI